MTHTDGDSSADLGSGSADLPVILGPAGSPLCCVDGEQTLCFHAWQSKA